MAAKIQQWPARNPDWLHIQGVGRALTFSSTRSFVLKASCAKKKMIPFLVVGHRYRNRHFGTWMPWIGKAKKQVDFRKVPGLVVRRTHAAGGPLMTQLKSG